MDSLKYQKLTNETAVYPRGYAIEYLTMGLAGEIGEFLQLGRRPKAIPADEIRKELGDLMWFTAQLAELVGIELDDCLTLKMDEDCSPVAMAVDVNLMVGQLAKWYRGDKGKDGHEIIRNFVPGFWRKLLTYEIYIGGDVKEQNIQKLLSRKERGVLKGDGDDR